jgi:hypothetical protein
LFCGSGAHKRTDGKRGDAELPPEGSRPQLQFDRCHVAARDICHRRL